MSAPEPIETKPHPGGEQRLYRFDNGYGASVVRGDGVYGSEDGLAELCVIEWNGKHFDPTFETPITSDVLGWLSEDDVTEALAKVKALPVRRATR